MNELLEALSWALFVVGVVHLITATSILAPLRIMVSMVSKFLASGIYCGACVGFWVGVGTAIANWSPLYADHPTTAGRLIISGLGGLAIGAAWSGFGFANGVWAAEQEAKVENTEST